MSLKVLFGAVGQLAEHDEATHILGHAVDMARQAQLSAQQAMLKETAELPE